MNRVGTGWSSLWWLRFWEKAQQETADNASSVTPPQHSLVFVSLPKKWGQTKILHSAHAPLPYSLVYTQPPGATTTRPGGTKTAKSSASKMAWRMLPLVVLMCTAVGAVGMLQMLAEGVQMVEYYPAGYLKTQSWRNGSGPSPLDAVKSEYQNALTREMVRVRDTGVAKEVAEPARKKDKVDARITLSNTRYRSSVKEGLRNLNVKVFNGTKSRLEKVIVEVDFLGKRGKLLKTETYTATDIRPQQEKLIPIPEGTPGLKIAYRVAEVRSRRHTTRLRLL